MFEKKLPKEMEDAIITARTKLGLEGFNKSLKIFVSAIRDSHLQSLIEILIKKKVFTEKEYDKIFNKILREHLEMQAHPDKAIPKSLKDKLEAIEKEMEEPSQYIG